MKVIDTLYNTQPAHLSTLNDDDKIVAFQKYVHTKTLADAETN